jgi:hypothetical protein
MATRTWSVSCPTGKVHRQAIVREKPAAIRRRAASAGSDDNIAFGRLGNLGLKGCVSLVIFGFPPHGFDPREAGKLAIKPADNIFRAPPFDVSIARRGHK